LTDISRFIASSESLVDLTGRVNKPCVTILGSYNSGKSTLLNKLLEFNISPVGVIPTTPCLLYFEHGHTFSAAEYGSRKKKTFRQAAHLRAYLTSLKTRASRIVVEVPSPFLTRCSLMDTPGIDSINADSEFLAKQAVQLSDKIVYLFHQRGIEDMNRHFLYKLAVAWKNNKLDDISFWLNCNLGICDGSSLETTRAVLREIFLSPVRLNTINTFDSENIDTLRTFLEVEAARETLRLAGLAIKKVDDELPFRINKAVGIQDDAFFLSNFWGVMETTQKILEANRIIHTIPAAIGEMESRFKVMNDSNLGVGVRKPGGKPYRPKTAGIKENRGSLLDFITTLLNIKELDGLLDRPKLEDLYCRINAERFAIVVAGGFSTGKTTFINALLKEEMLPAADGPTTASVTKVTYGDRKKARVYASLQTTLRVCGQVGGKTCINREELGALEKWLNSADSDIAYLEACVDGRFSHVGKQEMAVLVKQLKEIFAAGSFARAAGAGLIPSAFKLLPAKWIKGKSFMQKARVTFKKPDPMEFDLEDQEGIKAFWDAIGPDKALKIEGVELQHPADYLRLSLFIDTPGLDWIQKNHQEKTSMSIKQSDAYLLFFNAKHIFNNMDRDHFRDLLWTETSGETMPEGLLSGEDTTFVVINFADTLTSSERETVYNFIHNSITSSRPANYTSRGPKIFLVSALNALAGEDSGMSSLLLSIEESILKNRAKKFYLAAAGELYSALDHGSEIIKEQIISGHPANDQKVMFRKAQNSLRESKRKLKDIRNTIYDSGRF